MIQDAMTVLDDIQYAHSNEYKARLEGLETMLGFTKGEQRKPYNEEYTSLVLRYGGRTERSWELQQVLAKQREHGILQNKAMYLDSGISQARQHIVEEKEMAICRQRVVVGYNQDGTEVYRQLQAKSTNDMNDHIVQAYIQSGRIQEFLAPNERVASKTETLFKPYVENWMKIYKEPKLKPRTYQTYQGYLHSHLFSAFGERFIEDIRTIDIQEFLNARKDQAKKSLKNYLALLGQIFEAAKEDKIIPENPTASRRIMIPSEKANPREALPEDEYRDVLSRLYGMKNGQEQLMLAILIFTGLRRGETIGLKWEDIDFEKRQIHIRRNVTHPHNAPVVGTPKTKNGVRILSFGEHFEKLLLPMKAEGFIFGGDKPISVTRYDTIIRHIKKVVDLHGATAHVLRHTYITTAEATNEVGLKTLQSIAGHGNSQTTMNIYVHPKQENLKAAGELMDNLLNEYAMR